MVKHRSKTPDRWEEWATIPYDDAPDELPRLIAATSGGASMRRLELRQQTIRDLTVPIQAQRGPGKPITAVCHNPVQRPSFACQIRRP